MKKISLTKMIILGLILGMIAGVIINNTAATATAKIYAQEISIFTTIFLRLVKMIIAPLVISTLVVGIAKMGDAKTLGRIFSKTFFLFICASLLSIALGLVIVNLFQPGVGINFVPHDAGAVAAVKSEPFTLKVFISHAVPHQYRGCDGA
ncbi:glutamate/aspartate:proton symporter [Salmonella enterica subsp. indica]|uniref:Glutamate/aspartate:proton symporter n=1 Tax=Salmonella enterica subsp. indica TaxID=59207 RepID=A0A379XSI2_SALER|nr:glutamate/aspartate:proton symporter [Salmonella enterica subsp. indica]